MGPFFLALWVSDLPHLLKSIDAFAQIDVRLAAQ
jgi:hypothetical protein